jgi:hypothetical protein
MVRPSPSQAVRQAEALLNGWLDGDARFERAPAGEDTGADLVVRVGPRPVLAIEVKVTSDSTSIAPIVAQARHSAARVGKAAVPVVVVPFMGEVGRRVCAQAGVSWFDLSGNAEIVAPGLRIHVEGKPNKYKKPGRPSTIFAPRSSRIVRQLLMEPGRGVTQRELARLAGLDEGFTSRIVHKLEADEHVERDKAGALHVKNADLLLDAWRETYDFTKHRVLHGHITGRSSDEALRRVAEVFKKKKVRCAATGLAAGWLLTKFAGFRLMTVFVAEEPGEEVLSAAGFRREDRGANTWLVVPNDEAVFVGSEARDGVPCVHPVQAYLDLKAQPERAEEAAGELRKQLLTWKRR